jgi:glycosyltransferase involved in cell wall biosynthesis
MARVGINPTRGKTINHRPADVTVALLSYIPDLSGYFEDRLDILKIVLESIKRNTSNPHDLLVFDNGSCQEVTDFLLERKQAGDINYLILSDKNIGKIDAFKFIFNAAPGKIIAYSDDDILFYPNWLKAQLEILNSFPNVGMVSGVPVRNASNHAKSSLEKLISDKPNDISVTKSHTIPDDWEIDWAISTGRDPEKHILETKNHQDIVLETAEKTHEISIKAIGSANHFQFISKKDLILKAIPNDWSGKLMGAMMELDEAIDQLGYLRLSTSQRYTRHLGNVLNDDLIKELQSLGLIDSSDFSVNRIASQTKRGKHWLLRIPGSRRALSAIYHRLFKILYQ